MEYTYILENKLTKNIYESSVYYILCYHIETQGKYPFLQFIMEKIPYCNNIIKEQFVLPHINNQENLIENTLNKISNLLVTMGLNNVIIDESMYKGIFVYDDLAYILINISEIKINALYLSRNSLYWFVLPTEIINVRQVCGFDIDEDVIKLFVENPQISILKNVSLKTNYNLPDVVYTGCDNIKTAEFNAIFGNIKTRSFKSCGKYYYFNRLFETILTNKYINRYALFIEGNLYIEKSNTFSLTDESIEMLYPENSIIICYKNNTQNPDILVKKYDIFISLSYHQKTTLL